MQKLVIVKYIKNGEDNLCFSARSYAYAIQTQKKISKGDFIVIRDWCGQDNDDTKNVSVVKVIEAFADRKSEEALRFIEDKSINVIRDKVLLGKADIAGYFEEVEKAEKRKELSQRIEKRFKEAEKEALYRKLAETDPEMKALLEELDSLK